MIILFLKLKKNVKKKILNQSMDMHSYNKLSKFNLSPHYNISRMLGIIWLTLPLILISYIKIITFTQIAA